MSYSAQYGAAMEAFKAAGAKFSKLQKAYRAQEIGDAEFLAGRAEYLAADKAFDIAEAAEDAAVSE